MKGDISTVKNDMGIIWVFISGLIGLGLCYLIAFFIAKRLSITRFLHKILLGGLIYLIIGLLIATYFYCFDHGYLIYIGLGAYKPESTIPIQEYSFFILGWPFFLSLLGRWS